MVVVRALLLGYAVADLLQGESAPFLYRAKTKERDSGRVMEVQAAPLDVQTSAAEMLVAGVYIQMARYSWPPICPQLQERMELREAPLELYHLRIPGTTPLRPNYTRKARAVAALVGGRPLGNREMARVDE
jgi:hypothetical protein